MRKNKFGLMRTFSGAVATVGLVLATALVFSACSSLQKKAEDLYDGGDFEGAASVYQAVLTKDPQNTEAQLGLRNSRSKLIDQRLIEIRKTRLAQNRSRSLDLFNELLDDENSWKIYPAGAVAFTQSEETEASTQFLAQNIHDASLRQTPLKAHQLILNYDLTFHKLDHVRQELLKNEMKTEGVRDCLDLQKESLDLYPHLADFAVKFCHFWGSKASEQTIEASQKIGLESYSGIKDLPPIQGLPENLLAVLKTDITDGFKKTAWFDSRSLRKAAVSLAGVFDFHRDVSDVQLYHEYTVSEAYTDYEDVTRYREVPYQESILQYDATLKTVVPVTVNRTRTESYVERVPKTRYRDVQKTFPFTGRRYDQHAVLNLTGQMAVNGENVVVNFAKDVSESATAHDVNMPNIGLFPKKLSLPEKEDWASDQFDEFKNELRQRLAAQWDSRYCQDQGVLKNKSAEDELVFKCLRQRKQEIPAFVAHWFETHLGVTVEQANQVIGLF